MIPQRDKNEEINVLKLSNDITRNELKPDEYRFEIGNNGEIKIKTGSFKGRNVTELTQSERDAISRLKSILGNVSLHIEESSDLRGAIVLLEKHVLAKSFPIGKHGVAKSSPIDMAKVSRVGKETLHSTGKKTVDNGAGPAPKVDKPEVQERQPSRVAGKEPASGSAKPSVLSQSGSVVEGGPEQPQELSGEGRFYYPSSIDYDNIGFVGFEEHNLLQDFTIESKINSLSKGFTDFQNGPYKLIIVKETGGLLILTGKSNEKAASADEIMNALLALTPPDSSPLWNKKGFPEKYINVAAQLYSYIGRDKSYKSTTENHRECDAMRDKLFPNGSDLVASWGSVVRVPATECAVVHLNRALKESKGVITPKVKTLLFAIKELMKPPLFNAFFLPLSTMQHLPKRSRAFTPHPIREAQMKSSQKGSDKGAENPSIGSQNDSGEGPSSLADGQIGDDWEELDVIDIQTNIQADNAMYNDKQAAKIFSLAGKLDVGEPREFLVKDNELFVITDSKWQSSASSTEIFETFKAFIKTTTPSGFSDLWMNTDFTLAYMKVAIPLYKYIAEEPSMYREFSDKEVCSAISKKIFPKDFLESEKYTEEVEPDLVSFVKNPATKMAVIHLSNALAESGGVITFKVQTLLRAMQQLTVQTQQATFNKYFGRLLEQAPLSMPTQVPTATAPNSTRETPLKPEKGPALAPPTASPPQKTQRTSSQEGPAPAPAPTDDEDWTIVEK